MSDNFKQNEFKDIVPIAINASVKLIQTDQVDKQINKIFAAKKR